VKNSILKPQTPDSFLGDAQASDASFETMKRFVGYSAIFHTLIIVVFTVRGYLSPAEPLRMQHTIHVDMVGLPDKVPQKLPPTEAVKPAPPEPKPELPVPEPPAPKPEVKPHAKPEPPKPVAVQPPKPETPKVNLNKTKQDQASALKRLEAIEKLQKMASNKPSENTNAKAAPAPKPESSLPIHGNEVSAGSSLKGLVRAENENYTEALYGTVKRHWNLPQWMANANLSAKVQLFIDAHGNVLKKVMTHSSGNPVYDERVMNAIEAATPLPKPPSDLANLLAVRGVELEFTPEH
jgi:TonB family protein